MVNPVFDLPSFYNVVKVLVIYLVRAHIGLNSMGKLYEPAWHDLKIIRVDFEQSSRQLFKQP
ncbi:hypothetical protein Hanom_Chr10g00952931 [Helianthus anomalus]